jgi:NAD(P)-dependent dehydrogenase (short-subunit alcohol dehydrogenase family)
MGQKTALITGCSEGGIGHALAKNLAAKGYNVFATVRKAARAGDLTSTENVTVLELDVRDDASVQAALAKAGIVDVLVNNAGFEVWGPLEEMTVADIKDQFETNVYGPFRLITGLLPGMRNRGSGVIVNVSSVAGRVSAPLNGLYSASKFALEALTETLHYECGHFGIRVHLIEPGGVATPFGDNRRLVGAAAGKESPYTPLIGEWEAAGQRLNPGGGATAESVAGVIVDAIENGGKLRYPATPDANMVFAARTSMNDEQFEAAMRQQLGLTW